MRLDLADFILLLRTYEEEFNKQGDLRTGSVVQRYFLLTGLIALLREQASNLEEGLLPSLRRGSLCTIREQLAAPPKTRAKRRK